MSVLTVLEWVSLYWFSRAGPAASLRIYYEVGFGDFSSGGPRNTVPLGVSLFPKELLVVPKTCVGHSGNIQLASNGTEFFSGGFVQSERSFLKRNMIAGAISQPTKSLKS